MTVVFAVSVLLSAVLFPCIMTRDILPVSFPSPYYYLLPETLVVIPCLAQQVDLNGSLHTLNATFFRNSSTINVYYPPAFHFVSVDQEENVVGLGVSAAAQDNHTLYHCQVGGLLSVASRVFVGDGVPLSPVTPIVQTRQTLDTVTIVWGYAPVPGHAPLLGYTVTLASCPVQSSHHDIVVSVQVSHEKTELTLLNLSPSGTYCISVRGWNSLGNGEVSTAIVTTVTGLVPPPPTNVTAISLGEGLINITWQAVIINYDVMTPLQDYLISYGIGETTPNITATIDNATTSFRLLVRSKTDNLNIGVASRNSIGHSQFTYTIAEAVPETFSLSDLELVVVLGTVAAVLLMLITLAIAILILLCWQVKHLTSKSTDKLSSPGKCDSPNIQIHFNPLGNVPESEELQNYLSEPSRLNFTGVECISQDLEESSKH